jgi:hypothetical protein
MIQLDKIVGIMESHQESKTAADTLIDCLGDVSHSIAVGCPIARWSISVPRRQRGGDRNIAPLS